jgi:hypothetical protein
MIEMLRIYSNGFLENGAIEELPPDPLLHCMERGRLGRCLGSGNPF